MKRPVYSSPIGIVTVRGLPVDVGARMTAGDLAAVQKLYLNLSIFVQPSTAIVKYTVNGSVREIKIRYIQIPDTS